MTEQSKHPETDTLFARHVKEADEIKKSRHFNSLVSLAKMSKDDAGRDAIIEECAKICEKPRIWDAARGIVRVVAQCLESAEEIRALKTAAEPSTPTRDYCEACGYTDSHDPNCPRPKPADPSRASNTQEGTPRVDTEEGDATNAIGEPVKVVLASFAHQLERERTKPCASDAGGSHQPSGGGEENVSKTQWVKDIIDAINSAVADKSISKEALAEGLEEIEDQAGEWARQMREELK